MTDGPHDTQPSTADQFAAFFIAALAPRTTLADLDPEEGADTTEKEIDQ
jgi:hypothetical protein